MPSRHNSWFGKKLACWTACVALLMSAPPTSAQEQGRQWAELVLVRNRPLVALWVNEVGPYQFLLDTAGSVSLIDTKVARYLALESAPGEAVESAGLTARPVQVRTLHMAGDPIAPGNFLETDLSPLEAQLGTPVAGIVASHCMPTQYTLDFQGGRVILGEQAALNLKFAVPLRFEQGVGPVVEASITGKEPRRCVIDTAFGGIIAMPKAVAEESGLLSADTPRIELLEGEGNPPRVAGAIQIRVESVSIGKVELLNPLCVIEESGDLPRIGVGFLKTCRVGVDLLAGNLYLKPVVAMPTRDEPVLGTGLALGVFQDGLWSVNVAKESPAARAGLLPGDRIVQVNGVSMRNRPHESVHESLTGEEGELVELIMRRGADEAAFDLVVEELL